MTYYAARYFHLLTAGNVVMDYVGNCGYARWYEGEERWPHD